MKFRTEIPFQPSPWQLDHSQSVVCMGSCFADLLGQRLQTHRFRTLVNPFGILFHPQSLVLPLLAAIREENPFEEGLFLHEGQWRHLDLHSSMRHRDPEFLKVMIRGALAATRKALTSSSLLVLTLGTALAWRHLPSGRLVANCHKLPGRDFRRERIPLHGMQAEMEELLAELAILNPELRVLLTVSPVRHLRSGLVENGGSKALLRVLCDELCLAHPQVSYFPAYELLMDELRDYRFYAADMSHPSPVAEEYVWNKFAEVYLRPETRELCADISKALNALNHRPQDQLSEAYQQHLLRLQAELLRLNMTVDMELEIQTVQERLVLWK